MLEQAGGGKMDVGGTIKRFRILNKITSMTPLVM